MRLLLPILLLCLMTACSGGSETVSTVGSDPFSTVLTNQSSTQPPTAGNNDSGNDPFKTFLGSHS